MPKKKTPANHRPAVILTDADGLADNTKSALLVLDISRQEIESGNVASALERLMVMSDSREVAYRYKESLLFQVGGYDGDRRELPEIPEVRAFFTRLVQEWPHWLWFLHRNVGAIPLLLALLCQVRIVRSNQGYGTKFLHLDELQQCLFDLLQRGQALFDAFDVTNEEIEASFSSAVAELER